MFTKLFKKSHDPYELGGRWYKIRVSSGSAIIESDIEGVTINGTHLVLPAGYFINTFTVVYKGTPTKSSLFPQNIGVESSGQHYVSFTTSTLLQSLPPYIDLYIHCIS